ncbi:MAG: pseudaminic acid biosynthesis-associated methylase [Candidatus Babeliales bacterium]|jgi:spore coat polysaccharide biosynthesis protein SpsF
MAQLISEQEKFWVDTFGDEYTDRNQGAELLASNIALFARIVRSTGRINSILEIGANRGLNLQALKILIPHVQLAAVEINSYACKKLATISDVEIYNQSIVEFSVQKTYDVVLSKGVLIHINPEQLPHVYDVMYRSSHKYICVIEYYNPKPVSLEYRGYAQKLFKRDFAGEILDRFHDVALVDYGFAYHRDTYFAQDDITWFLLEKK